MPRRLARTLSVSLGLSLLFLVAATSSASAYGRADQWQTAFSGTCSSQSACPFGPAPSKGASGFWGWCAFGGSDGSSAVGTTGTTADCQIATYSGHGGAGTSATRPPRPVVRAVVEARRGAAHARVAKLESRLMDGEQARVHLGATHRPRRRCCGGTDRIAVARFELDAGGAPGRGH